MRKRWAPPPHRCAIVQHKALEWERGKCGKANGTNAVAAQERNTAEAGAASCECSDAAICHKIAKGVALSSPDCRMLQARAAARERCHHSVRDIYVEQRDVSQP